MWESEQGMEPEEVSHHTLKPSSFTIIAVIGKLHFRTNEQNASIANEHTAIVQRVAKQHRHADITQNALIFFHIRKQKFAFESNVLE